MNNSKRLISFMLMFAFIVMTGCSVSRVQQTEQSTKLKVVASNFPAYDFARAAAGDNAQVIMLLPPGSESHSFDPTPQNIIAIEECDVFIYNGGESENWVSDILDSIDNSSQKRIAMMDCVETLEEEFTEGMSGNHNHSEEEHDEDEEYDEHVWTSPLNAEKIVTQISKTLSDADPENSEVYYQNAMEYCLQLEELDNEFKEIVSTGERKTLVFGDRMPFRYFIEEYDLEAVAAFPGCASETEPSAATVAFLIDKVNQEHIPAVLHLELSNEKLTDTICQDTGTKSLLLHSCHNVTKDDFDAGKTYIDRMRENANTLREALN